MPQFGVRVEPLPDRTLLKTGAAVVTIAMKQPDGSLLTNRVTVEKDGVKLSREEGGAQSRARTV
jgi:hypothetical protein